MKQITLTGLIIDLERGVSDLSRYKELGDGLRNATRFGTLREALSIELEYVHFTSIRSDGPALKKYDFFVLSPQGAPWSSYTGLETACLSRLAHIVRSLVFERAPFLAICGGHQFLVMAFGGEVSFIDNNLKYSPTERYPSNCLAERGPVNIKTVCDDPIFYGLPSHPTELTVAQNHVEEVKVPPPGFVNLAFSDLSEIQIIRFPGRIVYGMAFHPERGWDVENLDADKPGSHGRIMLGNFLSMVLKNRNIAE